MKLTLLLLLAALLQVNASTFAQNINLKVVNVPVEEVLNKLQAQTSYDFLYNAEVLEHTRPVSIDVKNVPLLEVLRKCFPDPDISFSIDKKTVLIKKNTPAEKPAAPPLVVTGTVIDENGQSIPAVSVMLKGTKTGTQTSIDGKFRLTVPDAKTEIVFSSIGYKTVTITADAPQPLIIKMISEPATLQETVVIGYQTVKRRDLSGAVSSVNAQQIKDIPVNSTFEALTGRLAGVQIVTSDGQPGAAAQIKIRGGTSITQDNSPLYVIDGVQVEDGLAYISPQDIETVDVLKDAASTAIYGARGANGVVIITTKSGKGSGTIVSVNSFASIRKLAKELPVMDPYNFVVYQYERTRGSVTDSAAFASTYGVTTPSTFSMLDKYKNTPAIDWQQELFGRNAFMNTNNVSISGGNKTTQFNLSGTQTSEQGTMLNTQYDRKLINFKLDHQASNKFRVGFTMRYNNQANFGPGTTEGTKLRSTVKYRPMNTNSSLGIDDYDAAYFDETNGGNSLGLTNPVVLSKIYYRKTNTDAFNTGVNLNYKFNKAISFRSTLGFNLNVQSRNSFDDTLTNNSRKNAGGTPIVREVNTSIRTLNNSNVFTLTNAGLSGEFNKLNHISLLLGEEVYTLNAKSNDIQLGYFPIGITPEKALGQLSLGTVFPLNPVSNETSSAIVSGFTRLDYAYNSKYIASFSMRADASSKFAPGNRLGYFPAGSVAWRISEEKFMRNVPAVSDLKLRASYGESGNNRINDYLYLTTMSAYLNGSSTPIGYGLNDNILPAYASSYLANPLLKWEKAVSRNIGLDIGLFQNRVQLSVDAYINDGQDLLVSAPIPSTSGYAKQLQNIGTTSNRGIEFQLSGTVMSTKAFNWTANLNISFNKNIIKKLAGNQDNYLQSSAWGFSGTLPDYQVKVGEPVGDIYGFVTDGMYTLNDFNYNASNNRYTVKPGVVNTSYFGIPQPGYIKIKDLNGDGIVDPDNDRKVLGNAQPKFFGGLNQQFTYKNFDLSIFLNFSYGNKMLNASKIEFENSYNVGTNLLAEGAGRWKTIDANGNLLEKVVSVGATQYVVGAPPAQLAAANPNATIWQPLRTGNYAEGVISSAVEDGSFLRVNNLTLGYSFSPRLLSHVGIKKLRFYVTGNNLAIITGYSGLDPEVNTQTASPLTPGVDFSAYPRSRTYVFGLNLTL